VGVSKSVKVKVIVDVYVLIFLAVVASRLFSNISVVCILYRPIIGITQQQAIIINIEIIATGNNLDFFISPPL
jgi:hypothetical protein